VEIKGWRCRTQNERHGGAAILPPSSVKQREVRKLVSSVRVLVTESGYPTKTWQGKTPITDTRPTANGLSILVLKILWSYVKEMVRFDVYTCSEKARYQPSYFERSLLMLALDKAVFIGKDEEADCDREMEGNKQGRFQEEGHDEENKEDEGREEFNAALRKFDPSLQNWWVRS
jgi:hypothetical protein